jgi:hypothetical protein
MRKKFFLIIVGILFLMISLVFVYYEIESYQFVETRSLCQTELIEGNFTEDIPDNWSPSYFVNERFKSIRSKEEIQDDYSIVYGSGRFHDGVLDESGHSGLTFYEKLPSKIFETIPMGDRVIVISIEFTDDLKVIINDTIELDIGE